MLLLLSRNQGKQLQSYNRSDQALGAALLNSFRRTRVWLILLPIVLGALSYAASYLLKERWVASGIVQVGTIGSVSGGAQQHIEPLARAIERLRLRPFQDLMLRELGIVPDERNPMAVMFRRTLWTRQIPGTDLIEISIQANSKEQAVSWVAAVAKRLQKIHADISEPHVRQLKARFASLKHDVEQATDDRKKLLDGALSVSTGSGHSNSGASTLAVVAMLQGMEVNTLERTLAVLEEQLGPLYTRSTSLVFAIETAQDPVYPDRPRVALLGALIGLICALAITLVAGVRSTSLSSTK